MFRRLSWRRNMLRVRFSRRGSGCLSTNSARLREGIIAPMSQKNGKKMPMINMTQWPFLIVRTPRVTMSTK